MARLFVVVLAVIAAACFVGSIGAVKVHGGAELLPAKQQQDAKKLNSVYGQIDRYLVSINGTDARSLINGIKAVYMRKQLSPMGRMKPEHHQLRKALRLFAQLSDALDSCNYRSYEALALNHLAMDADSDSNGTRESVRALRDIAKSHAYLCRPKYQNIFRDRYVQLDQKVLASAKAVQMLFSDLKQDETCIVNPLGFGQIKPTPSRECVNKLAQQLLSVSGIKKMSLDKFLATSEKFHSIIEEHLVKPCRVYYEHFKQVFAPAIYDASLEDFEQKDFLYPSYGYFGQNVRYFRGCEYVLKDKESLWRLLLNEISDIYRGQPLKDRLDYASSH